MSRTKARSLPQTSEREALRRRVLQMYKWFNEKNWTQCYSLLDPKLRAGQKTDQLLYTRQLQAFHNAFGTIETWYIRINLYLDAESNKHDPRAFAYVYVVWQDKDRAFHIFRERWVKNEGKWFTRVAGLVANQSGS